MRAQIVKLSNEGEKVLEDQFVLDEDRAMEMFEDYILDDPEMDDYVLEKYAAFVSGRTRRVVSREFIGSCETAKSASVPSREDTTLNFALRKRTIARLTNIMNPACATKGSCTTTRL